MTREEMREKVARAIRETSEASLNRDFFLDCADAAIALIRLETLEEAAQQCMRLRGWNLETANKEFAAAIRALKEKDNG